MNLIISPHCGRIVNLAPAPRAPGMPHTVEFRVWPTPSEASTCVLFCFFLFFSLTPNGYTEIHLCGCAFHLAPRVLAVLMPYVSAQSALRRQLRGKEGAVGGGGTREAHRFAASTQRSCNAVKQYFILLMAA